MVLSGFLNRAATASTPACAGPTSLSTVDDLVEGFFHLLADGEDEVQHLAPVACHILAKGLELTLVVVDAAERTHTEQ